MHLGFRTNHKPRYKRVVAEERNNPEGHERCTYGKTTGRPVCGDVVDASDSVVVRSFNSRKDDQVLTDVVTIKLKQKCSVTGGDSGGPAYVNGKSLRAIGLIHGKEPDPSCPADEGGLPGQETHPGDIVYVSKIVYQVGVHGARLVTRK